jgi:hypothetical protein
MNIFQTRLARALASTLNNLRGRKQARIKPRCPSGHFLAAGAATCKRGC